MKKTEEYLEILDSASDMEAIETFNRIKLDIFRAGMLHAAALKFRCAVNECDGVDFLKKEIRKAAKQLKELPI